MTNIFPALDLHCDCVLHCLKHSPEAGLPGLSAVPGAHLSLEGLARGRVRLFINALYYPDAYNGPDTALPRLNELLAYAATHLDGTFPVRDRDGLEAALSGELAQTGVAQLIENADALLEADVEALVESGIRIIGLTHVGQNRVASGNAVKNPAGLTPAGRDLLGRLARAGAAVDLAHLPEPGFSEALAAFAGPVLCSHTGLRAFFDVPRNLSRDQVERIGERGGVVGVAFAPEILSPDSKLDVDGIAQRLETVAEWAGIEAAALGSDFGGYDGDCIGLSGCADLPTLADALLVRGFTETEVNAVFFGNAARVLRSIYPR